MNAGLALTLPQDFEGVAPVPLVFGGLHVHCPVICMSESPQKDPLVSF